MKSNIISEIEKYVSTNIGSFHSKRIQSLEKLKLKDILKRKNPYLFKAKNILTAHDIVKGILDAHLSSNEETIFGEWLEGLAIFINRKIYNGRKSGIVGIDLEFDKDNVRYIVNIKSGPNWGNRSQIDKMVSDFTSAKRTLKTSNSTLNVIAINGCCYGKDSRPYKKRDYYKYCGQEFWEFISGMNDLYLKIIKPLGNQAKKKNQEFIELYSNQINKFTMEFSSSFCTQTGSIDWDKLLKFNSGKK
jgi:hypothetical protein